MNKLKYLKNGATLFNGCEKGLDELNLVRSEGEMVDTFYHTIDFCLANNFPDLEFIKGISIAEERGLIVSKKLIVENKKQLVLFGKCDIEAIYDKFAVGRIYVKGESQLIVKAKCNSFLVIDALDNSTVHVTCSDDAKVAVYLYGNAKCTGATKIINTGKETYDLQAR